ncbi:ABC transporter ATP-binding protein [Desulfofundulus salinus]|uniref:ABC transporter ATP-binding protein n=1 Tax=Desulfofundulus salinus TaxID=2419843 RepID=A0A494WQR2_9FIRM|nr:ABC transporter ATP-binding protein [Desulfofundulus salinum]RKO65489.1 ABC transporter ATP-binding protein [Desulfofundulus salinum]
MTLTFQQPKVLLLDEPTSHLDLRNKVLTVEVLRSIASRGIIVITTEHDPNLASVLADRVLLMKNGKVISYGKVKDVLSRENLIRLYETDIEVFEKNGVRYVLPIISDLLSQ